MKYLLFTAVVLVMCSGCSLLQETPDCVGKMLITGAFDQTKLSFDTGGSQTITTMESNLVMFSDEQLAYGGMVEYWGVKSAGYRQGITMIGPMVKYAFPLEDQDGILPYAGGSIGFAQNSEKFGPFSDHDNGQYLRFIVGAWFFLSENWVIDVNLSATRLHLHEAINDISLGVGIGLLFGGE